MEDVIRIGTLGAAKITPGALLKPAAVIPAASIVAVAASSRARAESFAAEHAIEQVYDSYTALVEAPDLDLIYNPLPIDRHADLSIGALQAGKHVLCEKPFAMNAAEAAAVLAAADRHGKRVIEAFHYRYHPAFAACMAALRAGKIGRVRRVDAGFSVGIPFDPKEIRHRPENGGGAMMDLGCYPLHWTLMLLDESPSAIEADATLTRAGVDESMRCRLQFPGDVEAHLHCSMQEGQPFSATLRVEGSAGTINFANPLHPHNGGQLLVSSSEGEERIAVSPISTYTWQLAAVVEALRSDTPLPTEGGLIQRQQEALDAVYSAAGLAHLRTV